MTKSTAPQKPVLNFKEIFGKLSLHDRLEGYDLFLGPTHVPLQELEKAYLKADMAGMHVGALVQFNDGSGELGVVIGRNIHVLDPAHPAARMPVKVDSSRGGKAVYSLAELTRVPLGLEVEGLTHKGAVVSGILSESMLGVDDDESPCGLVNVAGTSLLVRRFSTLRLVSPL